MHGLTRIIFCWRTNSSFYIVLHKFGNFTFVHSSRVWLLLQIEEWKCVNTVAMILMLNENKLLLHKKDDGAVIKVTLTIMTASNIR